MFAALDGALKNRTVPELRPRGSLQKKPSRKGREEAGKESRDEEEQEVVLVNRTLRDVYGVCGAFLIRRALRDRLGEKLRFIRVLGLGGYHLVLEVARDDGVGDDDDVRTLAVRIPLPPLTRSKQNRRELLESTLAAYSFCLDAEIPVPQLLWPIAPVLGRAVPLYGAVMHKACGKPLNEIWSGASTDLKKSILLGLAKLQMRIFSHPFTKTGGLRMTQDGKLCVGRLYSTIMDRAVELAGADAVNRGPYLTWEEYAMNHVSALRAIFGKKGGSRGSRIVANLKIAASIVPRVAQVRPAQHAGRFYLCHPDLHGGNVFVDETSGEITDVIDWDGANVEPFDCFAVYPPNKFAVAKEEEAAMDDELRPFFADAMRQLGCPEYADLLMTEEGGYNIVWDFAEALEQPISLDPKAFEYIIFHFLSRVREAGYLSKDIADKIVAPPEM